MTALCLGPALVVPGVKLALARSRQQQAGTVKSENPPNSSPVARPHGMTDERLEWHLWNWEQWHWRQRAHYGRGYASQADGGVWRSGSSDLDAMIEGADTKCAKAVEAILNDRTTPLAERCAMHNRHLGARFNLAEFRVTEAIDGIAVYRKRITEADAYKAACERVRKGLTKRGID